MIKPSAIIFDFDDTLVESKFIIRKCVEATFKHFNIDESILKNIDFNRSLRDYFRHIFADEADKARDVYYSHYVEQAKNLKAIENEEEVLKLLHKYNVYTAVVSNKNGPRLRYEIDEYFAWRNYFD